jgi:hypothetical protein
MPGAFQDLTLSAVFVLARQRRMDEATLLTQAERPALMRAAVPQGEIVAAEIKDPDRAPRDLDNLAPARRDLLHRGDDMFRHGSSSR